MKNEKKFVVQTIENKNINYESIYEKMEAKKKMIEEIKHKIIELKKEHGENCEDAIFLEKGMADLKEDIVYLWDVFRGKIRKIVRKTIYVPMSAEKAVNYLAFLLEDNAIKNQDDIRCVLSAIKNDPGLCDDIEDKKLLSRIKDNLNYIIKRTDNGGNEL